MSRRISLAPYLRPAAAALCAIGCIAAFAGPAQVSQTPLQSSSGTIVKPNIYFVLDTSGSMAWTHAPDDAVDFIGGYGYASQHCNSIYYNPRLSYDPPKKSDGTSFPNASFGAALYNGYDASSTKVNLGTSFQAYDSNTLANSGVSATDTKQAAYYFNYSGTQGDGTFTFGGPTSYNTVTTTTFYKECDSSIGNSPGKAVFTKVTLTSTSAEAQNFANWYSFYRTRILMMKSGASIAFASVQPNYRVGFSTIYDTPNSNTSDMGFLAINDFTQSQKDAWYARLVASSPSGGTPLRTALATAGQYYAGLFSNGKIANSIADPVQYSCQQNFTILTTDGYWNKSSAAPKDLVASTIGDVDGGGANGVSVPTFPFFDATKTASSLADTAYYYWATDLRKSGAKWMPGADCKTGVDQGSGPSDVCTDNVPSSLTDTASWQHMTTFTLGLGVNGTLTFCADYLDPKRPCATYNRIAAGTTPWPQPVGDTASAVDDLWHAAVNGHGQYFSAKDPDLLVSGLRSALAGVSAREAAGAAAATSNLEPSPGDNFVYIASYRTVKWDGDIDARQIDLTTGIFGTTNVWSGQAQLDAVVLASSDSRKIFTPASAGGPAVRDFLPGNFTTAEKSTYFDPRTDTTASGGGPALSQSGSWSTSDATFATPDNLINYLRGQFFYETRAATTNPALFRDREHVLGDIIDGKPVYMKKPPFNYQENNYIAFQSANALRQGAVYVAANDGMMHGFASDTGKEMWAYVPSFAYPKLKQLADANYATNHEYITDGAPTVADVWDGSNWRTILVAGLNAGGRGYYALDVTDATSPVLLWEFTDDNLGLTFGNPLVGKLTDGTWTVFVTSGYNNAPPTAPKGDGQGRLYALDALRGRVKFTIPTGTGDTTTPSNLGRISGWTDNGLQDNTIQRIYGGDMLGNLWRFDINNQYPDLASPAPKQSGRDAALIANFQISGTPQPITAKPELGLLPYKDASGTVKNVPLVFVGTGRYLGVTDVSDTSQQSLYGIWDKLTATAGLGDARTASACKLVQQSIVILDANTRVAGTPNPVDFSLTNVCGWYIDLSPSKASPGERINVDMRLQLGVLGVITNVPENSVCTIGGSSWIYFFNPLNGGKVGSFVEITDINGQPSVVAANKVGEKIGNSTAVGLNTYRMPDGRVITTVTTSDDKHASYGNPNSGGLAAAAKRVLWRELLQ